MVPEDLPFQFLRECTDDFSKERKLGEGRSGVVYKGVTKSGQDVAVKMMKPCYDNIKWFRNELHILMKLNHQNIVQVLGYCYERKKIPFVMPDGSKVLAEKIHAALCFEYLHNGSLQKHLSDESCEVKLDWHMRFKIIKGICEGLKHMHKDLEEPIYHFDLKPDNILLDKDMVPKIADFSVSEIFGQDIARTTHNRYGTFGYVPPEYIDRGEISEKFDIFSLGAVMIMIVSGLRDYTKSFKMSSYEYIDHVREIWRNKLQETCSSSDSLLEAYCHQVETCTQIALKCLDKESQKRPDILKITEKLNEIEIGVDKLSEKGCGISFSEMTVQNNSIEMRKESKDITVQHQSTDLLSSPGCTNVELIDAQEISTDVIEELIVGREEEKRKVVSLLIESSSNKISILPIHGIGGIGKTTFSRLIYNDPKFKCYTKAWVHVSHRFDLNTIRESIISQLSEKVNQSNERHVVHSSLTELLRGKNIMIVLDDLWEDNQFQLMDLRDMLYHDDSRIIILVTTRSESVAERICTNLQPYKILPLTNDMCWDIIKQRSGFEARDDKEKLRGIGQEIAQKCAGVALAAQFLGFTLQGKNFDQWMKVKDNDIWKEHILPNHVLTSLMLSYSYMDLFLKPCFTYCAIFPKGQRIVKNDLIYQWISLGFIKPTELLSVMDLCKKYIMQLQGQSFFQESPKTSEAYSEKATIFTMHDLAHDLAILLLGNQILDQSKQGNTRGSSCQYALLADCSKPLESCLTSQARLIALRFLDCRSTELHGAAFAPATSLRVLDLSECSIQKLPDSIGELKQLRYLKTPGVGDQMFPECITKLSHLIYLNLQGSSNISALPVSIGEMKDLMHLDLSGCRRIRRLPGSFMSLEKLVHLDFSHCSLILGESESLWSLSRLEHLSLSRCTINGDLAKALCGLTELQYLDLSQVFCSGNLCRGLQQVLVRFIKLRYLDISGFLDRSGVVRAETETFVIEAISSLSSLEYLNLSWNLNLNSIPKSIRNLRKLRTLDLSHCIQLERLPAAISGIDSLKILHVAGCLNLDKTTLTQYKNAGDGESSSNLCHLEYENPTILEIGRLENVKKAKAIYILEQTDNVTAVSSSLGAMGPLFRKLDLLLAPNYPLRRSIKHAIKLLKEDLEDIVDALVEQSMMDSPNHKAKYWMHEVRELSYHIEDVIDTMMLPHTAADGKAQSVHGHKVARLKIRRLPYIIKPSARFVRIAELRTLLWEASERHQRYELDACISNPSFLFSGRSRRVPVAREVAGSLVGIDAPRNRLTWWLTARAEQLKVLCIVGPAGVGKTALAKELYRELGSQFECRAFVRVSRTPHMSRLLLGILSQIQRPKQNSDTCSVPNIIDEIRKHLQDKRYFIVIDGLWEARVWDIIKTAFPKGHNCSRIIITCEVKDVATKFCSYHSIDVFELKPLDIKDTEKLFFRTMWGFNVQYHDQLKEVSYRILRECAGLPLATIAIAGLLASQPNNSDLWHLLQYFFSDLANLTLDELLKGTVNLCYNVLPQDLKTCLLYLTMYPEGCTIKKVDLLKQWIAEGFITPTKEGKEVVAENYFAELVNRRMIQPEKIMHNGEVLSCTVHHIVFDLIMHKSREENFTTAVDYSQTVTEFLMKVYRLSLHFSCAQYATKLEGIRLSQIRSLSFFGLLKCMPSVTQLGLLRVLILEFWDDIDECICLNLSRISGLVLLRYLKISSHLSVELPSKIQELKFLETLEIDARVRSVPDDIVHLPGLLHLSIQDEAKLPEGIGRVTSLQTLQYFDLGNNSEGNVRSLCELINLRDLHITCSTALSDAHLKRKFVVLAASLPKLTNLRSLTMAPGAVSTTMFVDYSSAMLSTPMFLQRLELLPPICIFSRLPKWVGKLQELRILKIVVRVLLSSDIDVLTGLPGLTVLSLYIRQPNTQRVVFSSGALPVLKYFKYTCGALFLAFQEEALPNLERLKLRFNVHKDEMYYHRNSGIENLLNLKEMTVKIGAADDATESDKKAAESAIEGAILKHPRFPIYMNVRRIGWVEEE